MAVYPYYYQQPNYYGYSNSYLNPQQMQQQLQPTQMSVANQQTQQPQIQQSGFVPVQSEQEARSYPVAPGNSITFKDESRPYCYVKTMGFNQLDRPIFERYKLVKEDDEIAVQHQIDEKTDYALKSDLATVWKEIEAIKAKLEKKTVKVQKQEAEDDE